jgi:hypothetical protein
MDGFDNLLWSILVLIWQIIKIIFLGALVIDLMFD